jgi:hypothetical protein
LYGPYTISQGSYLFTLQNIINKRFELEQGGTITFNGESDARLNADAIYQVRTSTSYPYSQDLLLSSGGSDEATLRAKNRILVSLLLKLKGVLSSPEVSFDIRPQDPDAIIPELRRQ